MILNKKIEKTDSYSNLKEVLKVYFNISDRLLLKLKRNDKIYLNNKVVKNISTSISTNDFIEVFIDFEEDNSNIVPIQMDLKIVYEDESYIIVNKPAYMPVHPSMDHFSDSLSNGMRYYFDSINLKKKIRPVNRLDKNTSGLVIFAKNEYIQETLIRQMKNNIFTKKYIAICEGKFEDKKGIINAPIARKENSIIERCINKNGDTAITEYEVLEYNRLNNYSIVKCNLKTGRTHQIRVHLSYIGHPILGDTLYGRETPLINRQALHSFKLKFIHPILEENVRYIGDIPKDMEELCDSKSF